jgi:DnaJ-class molecular chaperone
LVGLLSFGAFRTSWALRKKQVGFGCGVLELFLQVTTVEGLMDLQVPAGTQPGDILVMPKLGMPKLNKPSSRGDHFFTIKVTIPIRLRYEVFVKLLHKTISAKHMEP